MVILNYIYLLKQKEEVLAEENQSLKEQKTKKNQKGVEKKEILILL